MKVFVTCFAFLALIAEGLIAFTVLPPPSFLSRVDTYNSDKHRRTQRLHYNSKDSISNNGDNKINDKSASSASSTSSTSSTSILSPTTSSNDVSSSSKSGSTSLARPTTEGPTLSLLLENMPTNEKYNILLQSYATKVMSQQSSSDTTNRNNQTLMNTMENLYIEMMQKSIKVERKTAQYMIDASSAFANTIKIGRSLQLVKATGTIKAFGVAIGQLSDIITDKQITSKQTKIPTDNRVEEVYWFTGVVASTLSWLTLEVYSKLNEDVHPYATLFGCACALVIAYDVITRNGQGLKLATKGFDRLILKDDEREAHCDSASFLVGYLLGLPCYPYKPDIVESIKMLLENPSSLQVYKQPRAIAADRARERSAPKKPTSNNFFTSLLLPSSNPIPTATTDEKTNNVNRDVNIPEMTALISSDSEERNEESLRGLGRVLIWLLSPVAAESMRYGESIISEPRRAGRLLSILDSIQNNPNGSNSTSSAVAEILYKLPRNTEEQTALLEWAYYESTQLVKIYGDVLEDLREMLLDSKSSVGECTMFLEEEIGS